jgi:hypothetical protein
VIAKSFSQRCGSLLGLSKLLINDSNQNRDLPHNSVYSLKSTKVGFNPPKSLPIMSPNLFHNPLTSGLNSAKHSPAGNNRHNNQQSSFGSSSRGTTLNHTATFAATSLGGAVTDL